jgi:methyltransferase (TIGR00027 family)
VINIARAIAFRIIQIVLLPVAVVGYVLFLVKVITYSRKSGVSATALAPLYTRYMQHKLGTRRDEPCERLMMVLPNVPHLGLRLTTGPTRLAHRLTGYVPKIYRYPYEGDPPMKHEPAARTTFFDAALSRHYANIDQFVILGAGWDTRAFRMPHDTRVRSFEVDTTRTQTIKRAMLDKAGVDAANVTFVTADFLTEDWLEKLVNAGFDTGKRSFFLWEGVTMYLDREAVEDTLRTIAGTARGGVVAFDYFSADLIAGRGGLYMRYARVAANSVGEPLRFGIESEPPARKHVAEFLAACGLTMEEQRNFGPESDRNHAMGGFTTAIVERNSLQQTRGEP